MNRLRTISASKEEQTLKFSILEQLFADNVVCKCRAISKLHFASCLFTFSCGSFARAQTNTWYSLRVFNELE